jgi:hypothetical protein
MQGVEQQCAIDSDLLRLTHRLDPDPTLWRALHYR